MELLLVLLADFIYIYFYIKNIHRFKYQPLFMVFMGTSFLFYMAGTIYIFFEKWYSVTFNRTLYLISLFRLDSATCTKAHYIYFLFLIGIYLGFRYYEKSHRNHSLKKKKIIHLFKGRISPLFVLLCSASVGLLHYYGIFSVVGFENFWDSIMYNNYSYTGTGYTYIFSSFLLGIRTVWITFIILLYIISHYENPNTTTFQKNRSFYKTATYIQIAAVIFICYFMGNRRDLLYLLVAIVLANIYSSINQLSVKKIVAGAFGLFLVSLVMSAIYSGRSIKLNKRVELLKNSSISVESQITTIAGSSEFIAPYSSLPNILKHYHGDFLLGKSFYWFLISFIPRYFYPARSGNYLYIYYRDHVLVKTNAHHRVGYALNIPADLYFNFGLLGIILLSPLCGLMLGYFEKAFFISKHDPDFSAYCAFYFSLASYSISLSRTNIEGVREFIYGGFLPLVVLVFFYVNRNFGKTYKVKNHTFPETLLQNK